MSLTYLNGSKSVQQGWKTTLPPQTSCGLGPAFQSSTHSKYFKSIFKLKGWGQIGERTCVGGCATALLIITPSTPYSVTQGHLSKGSTGNRGQYRHLCVGRASREDKMRSFPSSSSSSISSFPQGGSMQPTVTAPLFHF